MAKTFFLIGGFTFGGGQAMIQLIRTEIVERYHWMEDREFIDLFAMAQSLPGVLAVNISIFVGYRLQGFLGALVCAICCTLPSFTIILLIAIFASGSKDNPTVEAVFKGMRPVVVALIAAPTITIWKALGLGRRWVWIPVVVALGIWGLGISPVTVIIVSALAGWLYTRYICREGGGLEQ
ncbi:MAG: chromate transporter [Porphyromonas sp.]|nr:chromate transporter [Porphyromonas sp.]